MKYKQVYTTEAAQVIDSNAILHGTDGFELMRSAGRQAWKKIQQLWPNIKALVVFCGPGNNGGDGWIVASEAASTGCQVKIIAPKKMMTTNAQRAKIQALEILSPENIFDIEAINSATALHSNITNAIEAANTVIIDALFGIGLNKPIVEPYLSTIHIMNQASLPLVALDIPSGIHGSTGNTQGAFVKASHTITFIVEKRGLYRGNGRVAAGQVHLEDLTIPEPHSCLNQTTQTFLDNIVAADFEFRENNSHKGTFGTLVCVGGDEGMGGAIIIAAESAVRFGAGKVIIASSTAHTSIAITRCPSIISRSLDQHSLIKKTIEQALNSANSLVLGPGLGQSEWSVHCFNACLCAKFKGTIVLDADALNLIATNKQAYKSIMNRLNTPIVLTPHPKEALKLLECLPINNKKEIAQDPFEIAFALSEHFNSICLLKGHGTIIAYQGQAYICQTGNAALAKAGQGDCLSGMIGALLAQGIDPFVAARKAAWAHGLAGEVWSKTQSQFSLLPHETASIAAKAIQNQQSATSDFTHEATL